jgi:uncharacterized protein
MTANIDQHLVLDALRNPAIWPDRPDKVDVIETHAALIFLAGDAVLKVKRAVKLAYLDFSTLEARRRVCQREIELNAPHAPDLYRGLVPIRRGLDGAISIGGDTGDIVEWGVSMCRFPQDVLLSEMASRGVLTPTLMKSLADRVHAYHRAAKRETPASDRIPAVAQSILAAIAASSRPAVRTKSAEVSMLPLFSTRCVHLARA